MTVARYRELAVQPRRGCGGLQFRADRGTRRTPAELKSIDTLSGVSVVTAMSRNPSRFTSPNTIPEGRCGAATNTEGSSTTAPAAIPAAETTAHAPNA